MDNAVDDAVADVAEAAEEVAEAAVVATAEAKNR